jgi:hypothetical protein
LCIGEFLQEATFFSEFRLNTTVLRKKNELIKTSLFYSLQADGVSPLLHHTGSYLLRFFFILLDCLAFWDRKKQEIWGYQNILRK